MRGTPTQMPSIGSRSEQPSPVDESASELSRWIGRHQVGVWRYLRYLGCPASLAEDYCQDALLAALEHGVPEFEEGAAAGWLRTTVRNLWFMHLRSEKRRPEIRTLDWSIIESAFVDFAGDDGGEVQLQALALCLGRLPERERQAIDLRYGEEQSREQMARSFGISSAGVKAMLRRARERLRCCVESRLGGSS